MRLRVFEGTGLWTGARVVLELLVEIYAVETLTETLIRIHLTDYVVKVATMIETLRLFN